MNRFGKGICESCHFAKNCTLYSPDEVTWECSEYEPMTVFSAARVLFLNPRSETVSDTKVTLCDYCSLKSDCCYYAPEIFIFNCEHVQ